MAHYRMTRSVIMVYKIQSSVQRVITAWLVRLQPLIIRAQQAHSSKSCSYNYINAIISIQLPCFWVNSPGRFLVSMRFGQTFNQLISCGKLYHNVTCAAPAPFISISFGYTILFDFHTAWLSLPLNIIVSLVLMMTLITVFPIKSPTYFAFHPQ